MPSNKDVRHENLRSLIRKTPRGQSGLIKILGEGCIISQQNISLIKLGRRYLRDHEATFIEERLEVPKGWLERKDSLKSGFKAIQWYRTLDSHGKENFLSLVNLLDSGKQATEH